MTTEEDRAIRLVIGGSLVFALAFGLLLMVAG